MKQKPFFNLETVTRGSEFQRSVSDLTEAFVEDMEEMMLKDLEPYEAYANHIRHQVCGNLEQFRSRFTRGYQALLNEMKEIESDKEH